MVTVWVTNIVGILFVIIGTLLVLNVVFPALRRVLDGIAEDNAFIGRGILTLLIIYVYFLALQMILDLLVGVGNPQLNNVAIVQPGIDIVVGVYDILKWVIVGLVIALAFVKKPAARKKK